MLDGSGFHLGIAVLARELGYLDGRRAEVRAPRPRRWRRRLGRMISRIAAGLRLPERDGHTAAARVFGPHAAPREETP